MKAIENVTLRDRYHFGDQWQRPVYALAAVGVVGIVLALGLSLYSGDGLRPFAFSYLLNYCYFLSLSLGALCFVIVSHLTRSGWNVTWRRLAEVMAGTLPLWAILFLPILALVLFGGGSLFSWNDPELRQHDEVLLKKAPYLNATFFTIRAALYLLVWSLLGRFYLVGSRRQDQTGDKQVTLTMQKWSGPAIVAFGFTLTFASFDWLMSLDPHWFSTIYGVYYFSGSAVGFIAALILAAQFLQQRGLLTSAITVEHYHDLGKLLFGFVFFWGYIAFSQYMLIWYSNIPEETRWYLLRQSGGWLGISLLLLFGHLLLPFPGLLSRSVRRNRAALAGWSVWLLVMHWIDLYWLVMPQLYEDGPAFGLVDVGCLVGLGCVYIATALWVASDQALIAHKDPRLAEALAFKTA